jgi:uncharacterized protein (TIGR03083 family)
MTMTMPTGRRVRRSQLDRNVAMQLAATEYQRVGDLLQALTAQDWGRPTACPAWTVQDIAAHLLGMAEMAASIREQRRQMKTATRRGGVFIDALTSLQVEEHAAMSPADITARYIVMGQKAARARRRTPGFIRRRELPQLQRINDRDEAWSIGYLVDVILTRDPWMHRIDIVGATGATHVLTADHDGVIVDDLVKEWAERHGQPFTLRIPGPAGGSWTVGSTGPELDLSLTEFCRTTSRRQPAEGLLATEIPF